MAMPYSYTVNSNIIAYTKKDDTGNGCDIGITTGK